MPLFCFLKRYFSDCKRAKRRHELRCKQQTVFLRSYIHLAIYFLQYIQSSFTGSIYVCVYDYFHEQFLHSLYSKQSLFSLISEQCLMQFNMMDLMHV